MRVVGNLQDFSQRPALDLPSMQQTVTVNSLLSGPIGPLDVEGPSWTVPSVS